VAYLRLARSCDRTDKNFFGGFMNSSFQRFTAISLSVLISAAVLVVSDAEAKRIGGGGSAGRKSSNVSNRTTAPQETKAPTAGQPSAPGAAAPAAGAATAGAAAKAAPAAAAQSARSKWMGPLAGLAAGLGLAWLASSLGFGEGLANFMMIMLLAVVAFAAIRMFMNRGRKSANGGLTPATANQAPAADYEAAPAAPAPSSARSGSMIGSAIGSGASSSAQAAQFAAENASWRIPADMNVDAFLVAAKSNFMKLQSAYDRADLNELHEFTTAEMYKELAQDIVGRAGKANHTEVLELNAALLGVESDSREHLASVRFTGQVREDGGTSESIDEVWNMSKPVSGASGWVLAGVQQY
jgi:predicted lipid-binding transport protein (Tim44 family)